MSLMNRIEEVIVSEEEIKKISKRIGHEITEKYGHEKPILVGQLKGCVPFMAELIKHIDCEFETDYMVVSSYHGTTGSTGVVSVKLDLARPVKGKTIIIIEDIIDTGRTLFQIKKMFKNRGAKQIVIVTLIDKPEGRVVDIDPDIYGTTVPNKFLVGFGLDYKEYYRGLPFIGVLKKEYI